MRRFLVPLLLLATLAAAAPAGAARLTIQREPLYLRDGQLTVGFRCHGRGVCSGWLRATGRRVAIDLLGGERSWVRLPVRRVGRSAPVRVLVNGRRRVVERRVRHRTDRRTCGYGPAARTIDAGGPTRLLRVPFGFVEGDGVGASALLIACRAGDPIPVRPELRDEYGALYPTATRVTRRWVGLATHLEDHYGGCETEVTLLSLRTRRVTVRTLAVGDCPVADVTRLLVSGSGAVVVGASPGGVFGLRVVDADGLRVLDPGSGIDGDSVRLDGDDVVWRRDGTEQRARLRGAAGDA